MVYPHKQGICFPSQIRYPNDTGTLTSGRIVCPTIDNYENATIVKWYKVNKNTNNINENQIIIPSYVQPCDESVLFFRTAKLSKDHVKNI